MKLILTLIVAVIMVPSMFAQAPNKMSYQAVIRNSSNALVANKVVGIKISILQSTSTGTPVFVETHTPQTNANGLATLEIGGGSLVSGSFAGIDWGKGPYFIKTETDPTGGTAYTISGVSQVLSVPYALQSATASALSTSASGVVRSMNGKGGNLFLKGAGGTTINNNGDTISISSSGGSGGTGIQGVQSTDGIVRISNPNGPIATLNINDGSIPAEKLAAGVIPTSAGGDLSGTYPNPLVVKLQGRPITNTLPTSGQSLAWNGTAWAPSTVSSGWSLTGNTGINPLANFLGTKDSTPLIFNTFNSERMRISTTGNVGIGTITPVARLEIREIEEGSAIPSVRIHQHNCGPACAQTPGIALQIVNNNNTGIDNGARISFADSINVFKSDEGAASIHLINRVSAKGYGGLAFSTRNFQGFGERMRIDSSGRVGIGTSTPGKTLDVNGITRISDHLIFNNINGVINWGTADLYFRTNSTVGNEQTYSDKMIIKNDGKVGIGTTAPADALQIGSYNSGQNNYLSVKTSGGNLYKSGIKFRHFADDDGFTIESDETANQLKFIRYATATTSTSMVINRLDGNVGIGTTAPTSKLHVSGSAYISGGYISMCQTLDNSSGNVGMGAVGFNNYKLRVESNQTGALYIDATGGRGVYVISGTNVQPGGGSWLATSDARLKEGVVGYSDGLKELLQIQPVKYHYTKASGIGSGKEYVGVIAQEIAKFAPYMVEQAPIPGLEGEFYHVDNSAMTYMLINAVKEQQTEIESKDKAIQELQRQLATFESRVASLENASHTVGINPNPTSTDNQLFHYLSNSSNQTTSIPYKLVSYLESASIIIQNMNGTILKNIMLTQKGQGQVVIDNRDFPQGTYTYSLFVDGSSVDTKLLILTK